MRSPPAARSRYSESRALASNKLTFFMTILLTSQRTQATRRAGTDPGVAIADPLHARNRPPDVQVEAARRVERIDLVPTP
jgi:hypothetical protein